MAGQRVHYQVVLDYAMHISGKQNVLNEVMKPLTAYQKSLATLSSSFDKAFNQKSNLSNTTSGIHRMSKDLVGVRNTLQQVSKLMQSMGAGLGKVGSPKSEVDFVLRQIKKGLSDVQIKTATRYGTRLANMQNTFDLSGTVKAVEPMLRKGIEESAKGYVQRFVKSISGKAMGQDVTRATDWYDKVFNKGSRRPGKMGDFGELAFSASKGAVSGDLIKKFTTSYMQSIERSLASNIKTYQATLARDLQATGMTPTQAKRAASSMVKNYSKAGDKILQDYSIQLEKDITSFAISKIPGLTKGFNGKTALTRAGAESVFRAVADGLQKVITSTQFSEQFGGKGSFSPVKVLGGIVTQQKKFVESYNELIAASFSKTVGDYSSLISSSNFLKMADRGNISELGKLSETFAKSKDFNVKYESIVRPIKNVFSTVDSMSEFFVKNRDTLLANPDVMKNMLQAQFTESLDVINGYIKGGGIGAENLKKSVVPVIKRYIKGVYRTIDNTLANIDLRDDNAMNILLNGLGSIVPRSAFGGLFGGMFDPNSKEPLPSVTEIAAIKQNFGLAGKDGKGIFSKFNSFVEFLTNPYWLEVKDALERVNFNLDDASLVNLLKDPRFRERGRMLLPAGMNQDVDSKTEIGRQFTGAQKWANTGLRLQAFGGKLSDEVLSLQQRASARYKIDQITALRFTQAYVMSTAAIRSMIVMMDTFFGKAVEMNKQVETMRLSFGALVSSVYDINEAGFPLTGADKFNASLQISANIMRDFQLYAANTAVTFDELVEAFNAVVGLAGSKGVKLDDVAQYVKLGTVAVKSLGLTDQQVKQELRAMMSGRVRPAVDTLAASLNISGPDLKRWQEAGTLIFNLTKKFEMFTYANEGYVDTFTGAFERMQQSVAYALSPVYDAVLEQLKSTFNSITSYFIKEIVDENGKVLRMAINRDAIAPFKELSNVVASLIRFISEFGGTFKILVNIGLTFLKGYLAFRVGKGLFTGVANFARILKDAGIGITKFVSTFTATMSLLQTGSKIGKLWTAAGAAGAQVFPSTPWDKNSQFVGGASGKIVDASGKPVSMLLGGQAGGGMASSALGKAVVFGGAILSALAVAASIASDFYRFAKESRQYTDKAADIMKKSGDYLDSASRQRVRGMTKYMMTVGASEAIGERIGGSVPISQQDLTTLAAMMETQKGVNQLGYYAGGIGGRLEDELNVKHGVFATYKYHFERLNLERERMESSSGRAMLGIVQGFVAFYGAIEKALGWVVDLFGVNTRKIETVGVSTALLTAVQKSRQLDVVNKLPKLYADLMQGMIKSLYDSVAETVKQSTEMAVEKLSVSLARDYAVQSLSGSFSFDNKTASNELVKTLDDMFIELVSGRFATFKAGTEKVREWYEGNDAAKQAFVDFEDAYSSILSGDVSKVDKDSRAAFDNIRQLLMSGGLPEELSSATATIRSAVSSFADSIFDMFKTAIDAVKEVKDKVVEFKYGEQELDIFRQIKETERSMESLNKLEYLKSIAPQLRSSLGSISGAVSDLSKRASQLQLYSKSESEFMSGEGDVGKRAGAFLKSIFENIKASPDLVSNEQASKDISALLYKLTSVLSAQGIIGTKESNAIFSKEFDPSKRTPLTTAMMSYVSRTKSGGSKLTEDVRHAMDKLMVRELASYLSTLDFTIPSDKIGDLGMLFRSAGNRADGGGSPASIGYQVLEQLSNIGGIVDKPSLDEFTKIYADRNKQVQDIKQIENSLSVLSSITVPGMSSVSSQARAMWDQMKGIDAVDIPPDQLVAMMNVDGLRNFVTGAQTAIEDLMQVASEQDTTMDMTALEQYKGTLEYLSAFAKAADLSSMKQTIEDLTESIVGFIPGNLQDSIGLKRIMERTKTIKSVQDYGRVAGLDQEGQDKLTTRLELLANINDVYGGVSSAIDEYISSIQQAGARDFDPTVASEIVTKKDEYIKTLKLYMKSLSELGTDPDVVKAIKRFLKQADKRSDLAQTIKQFEDFKKGMDAISGFVGAEYLSSGRKREVADVYATLLQNYRDTFLDQEIADMGIQDVGLRNMVKSLRIEQINDEILKTLTGGLHSLYLSLYNAFDEFVESLSGAIASTLEDGLTSLLTGNFEDLKSFRENFTRSIASAISSFITEAIREAYIQPALESALSPLKSWLKSNVPQVMSNASSGGAQGELVTGVRDTAKGVDSLVKAQKTSTSSQMSVMKQASSPASQSKLSGALSGAFKFATITNLIPNLLSSFRTTDYNLGAYTQPSELLSMAESEKQWNTSNMMYGIMNSAFGALKYGKGLYDSLKFSSQLDSWLNPYNQVQATKNLVGGWSTGGYISVGAGNKDDVPALLQKGEYVVSKNAVDRYGKAFFEDLNVRRYASGGSVGFDPMSFASSTFSSLAPIGGYFGAAKLFGSEAAGMAGGFGAAVGGIAGSLLAGMRNNKILKSYMHAVERLSRYNYEDRATGPSMYIPSYLKTSDTSYMDEPFNADSYDTLRRYQKQYGGSSLVDTVEDQVNENKAQTQVTVNNILDPNLFDDYIRSAKGQDAILNVIKKVR